MRPSPILRPHRTPPLTLFRLHTHALVEHLKRFHLVFADILPQPVDSHLFRHRLSRVWLWFLVWFARFDFRKSLHTLAHTHTDTQPQQTRTHSPGWMARCIRMHIHNHIRFPICICIRIRICLLCDLLHCLSLVCWCVFCYNWKIIAIKCILQRVTPHHPSSTLTPHVNLPIDRPVDKAQFSLVVDHVLNTLTALCPANGFVSIKAIRNMTACTFLYIVNSDWVVTPR